MQPSWGWSHEIFIGETEPLFNLRFRIAIADRCEAGQRSCVSQIRLQSMPAMHLSWLTEVRERLHPVNNRCPIWVRHGVVQDGATCAHPEQHPYYEFGTNLAGAVTQWVKKEQAER